MSVYTRNPEKFSKKRLVRAKPWSNCPQRKNT